jgi:hypothetical protein
MHACDRGVLWVLFYSTPPALSLGEFSKVAPAGAAAKYAEEELLLNGFFFTGVISVGPEPPGSLFC